MIDFRNTICTISCDICGVILIIKTTGSTSPINEYRDIKKPFRVLCEDCISENFKYRIQNLQETIKKAEEQLSRIHKKKLEIFKDNFYLD